ncbi:UBX domain-containing protein 11 isoform X2 [Engraulis encrasicolus]|uniref:UBX domain-containing protein 11 isoform X2 n=1 Tax=Engraulis encrasicolus TaxID=184585 RepID=UPI002FCFB40C
MSSALSLLGKNRRVPLPGSVDEGRKRAPFKQITRAEHELGLLDGVFSSRRRSGPPNPVASPSRSMMASHGAASDPGAPAPSDFELMSSMLRKLTLLEVKVKAQAMDIQRKENTIAILEKKLQRKATGQGREEEMTEMCDRLQKQVWEMEKFLGDYGMIWVGDANTAAAADPDQANTEEDDPETSGWQPASSKVEAFRVNFDQVVECVRELNVLAGEGEAYVRAVPGGAQLARRSPVPLQLYADGILMFNGPFRPYSDPTTQQCMQDLMDGYFPSELQERFPDGVPFQLLDRREQEYKGRRQDFPGRGHMVSEGANQGAEQNPALSDQRTNCKPGKADSTERSLGKALSTEESPGRAESTERFLTRLPKSVIKAGKVIDIRGSIRDHLQESGGDLEHSHSVTLIDTPALQDLRKRLDEGGGSPNETAADISTLRVKSEDGEKTFILKMEATQTIGELRKYLDNHRCRNSAAYDIISVYPRRRYDNDAQTLAECGLTPSATLLLQPR